MQKIRTTLTILIFILVSIAVLSMVSSYYASYPPHISQQENIAPALQTAARLIASHVIVV
jgi:sensor histidine kinase regulating citrate/malate metabolism